MSSCSINIETDVVADLWNKGTTEEYWEMAKMVYGKTKSNNGYFYKPKDIAVSLSKTINGKESPDTISGEEFSEQVTEGKRFSGFKFENIFTKYADNVKKSSSPPGTNTKRTSENSDEQIEEPFFFNQDLDNLFVKGEESKIHLIKSFKQAMNRITFIDPEGTTLEEKITLNTAQLNKKINVYKNNLLNKIYTYLIEDSDLKEDFKKSYKDNPADLVLYNENGGFNPNTSYYRVLEDAAKVFKHFSTRKSLANVNSLKELEIYNAAIILTKFDSLVKLFAKDVLSVNVANDGYITNPVNTFQYSLEVVGIKNEFWNKEGDSGLDRINTKLINLIADNIPLLSIDGSPDIYKRQLGNERLTLVLTTIKDFELTNHQTNLGDDPVGNFKKALDNLRSSEKLEYKAVVDSLYDYLYDGEHGIVHIMNSAKKINQFIDFEIINIEAVLAHYANNCIPRKWGVYSPHDNEATKRILDTYQSEVKAGSIIRGIIKNLNRTIDFTKPEDKQRFLALFNSVSGVHLSKTLVTKTFPYTGAYNTTWNKFLKELNKEETDLTPEEKDLLHEKSINSFNNILEEAIDDINKIYLLAHEQYDYNDEFNFESAVEQLLKSPSLNTITTMILADKAPGINNIVNNSEGKPYPTVGLPTLAYDFATIVRNYAPTNSQDFVVQNSRMFLGVETLLEIEADKDYTVPAFYANAAENFFINFKENFVNSLDKGIMSVKISNMSDKLSIPNQQIDLNYPITFGNIVDTSLKDISLKDLRTITNGSINEYYKYLINNIYEEYTKLPGFKSKKGLAEVEKISQINDFLSTKTEKELKDLIYQAFKNDKSVAFVDQVHYSTYGKNKTLKFNNVIEWYFLNTQAGKKSADPEFLNISHKSFAEQLVSLAKYITSSSSLFGTFEDFKENCGKAKIPTPTKKDWVKKTYHPIANSTERISTEDVVFFKGKNEKGETIAVSSLEGIDVNGLSSIELNPLLEKWLNIQTLIRYNYLNTSTKTEFLQKAKIKEGASIFDEITARSKVMTKRNNIQTATMERFCQKLPAGIPKNIKVAVVDSISAKAYTYTGENTTLEAYDGGLFAIPFMGEMFKNSLPGKTLTNVLKIIGNFSNSVYSSLYKCALFTITNEVIRNSSAESGNVDWHNLLKKMCSQEIPQDINLAAFNGKNLDFRKLLPEGLYFGDGTMYKFWKLKKIGTEGYDYELKFQDVKTNDVITQKVEIKSVWDLYQVFGGEFSKSLVNGEYIYSEASVKAVTKLLALNPVLKDYMIGILADKSAVKNGAVNSNDVSRLKDAEPLMYSTIDTTFFGLQLDQSHTADESMTREISQVISALSQKQQTPEYYNVLYDAIGALVKNELEEYKEFYGLDEGQKVDYEKITTHLSQFLTNTEQIGNSKELLNIFKNKDYLPISNSNLYGAFITNVISNFSSDFIKRKFPGIGATLNPSYDYMTVREDANGNIKFFTDINSDDIILDNSSTELFSEQKRKALFSSWKIESPDIPTTLEEINPLDRVRFSEDVIIGTQSIKAGEDFLLEDIVSYYQVKDLILDEGVKIYKVLDKPRNLKPQETVFKITKKNYQELEADKLVVNPEPILLETVNLFDSSALKLLYIGDKTPAINELRILVSSASNDIKHLSDNDLMQKWFNRVTELVKAGFWFPTYTPGLISEVFAKDDLVSNFDITKINVSKLRRITSTQHKAAEAIMPKVYRSAFNIGNTPLSKINKDFFKAQYSKMFENIHPDRDNEDIAMITSNGYVFNIEIIDPRKIDANGMLGKNMYVKKHIVKREDKGKWYRIVNNKKQFQLTKEVEVYLKNGKEVLVFDISKNWYDNIRSFIKQNRDIYEVLYPFAGNINSPTDIDKLIQISKDFSNIPLYTSLLETVTKDTTLSKSESEASYWISLFDKLLAGEATRGQLAETFENISKKLEDKLADSAFVSFKKSLELIAARIPAQAMQSFMSMNTVGYTEEDTNNVYVSHWQLLLQGSDYDIDKDYIMMYGFKNNLFHRWSPYFAFDSIERLELSLKLPLPTDKTYIFVNNVKDKEELEKNSVVNKILDLTDFKDSFGENKNVSLDKVVELLQLVSSKEYTHIYIPKTKTSDVLVERLQKIIQHHNNYKPSSGGIKNFICTQLNNTANDVRNFPHAYSPINVLEYSNLRDKLEEGNSLNSYDGISMDKQQELAASGKDVVGIVANGLKDYFALLTYFSKDYNVGTLTGNKINSKYFERKITIEGDTFTINRIGGLNIDSGLIDLLNQNIIWALKENGEAYNDKELIELAKKHSYYSDPALTLSSLLSAATDNAKELILKSINAGVEFASMHIYLTILGFSKEAAVKFMTTNTGAKEVLSKMNRNVMADTDKVFVDSIVNNLSDEGQEYEFKKIYRASKELSFMAGLLSINGGLRATSESLIVYFNKFETYISQRLTAFGKNLDIVNILADKPYLREQEVEIADILADVESKGIYVAGKFTFDINKYFKNDNGYRKSVKDFYNLIKSTFNIFDVVESLPHFANPIEAAKMALEVTTKFSAQTRFIRTKVEQVLRDSKFSGTKVFGTNTPKWNEDIVKRAGNIFNDFVILTYLSKLQIIKPISFADIYKTTGANPQYFDTQLNVFKTWDGSSDKNLNLFGNSLENIDVYAAEFKNFMEFNLLPFLQKHENFSNNAFIKGLTTNSSRRENDRTWLSTKVKMGKLMDPVNSEIFFNYEIGLDELDNENNYIKFGEESYNIADLFFLYNLIVNKDKPGKDRLTKLFKNYIQTSPLAIEFYNLYAELDRKEGNNLFDDAEIDEQFINSSIEFGLLNKNNKLDNMVLTHPSFTFITGWNTKGFSKTIKDRVRTIIAKLRAYNATINFICE